jgi:DUF917 family protein
VPDLIAVLDAESAEPLTAEMLSYGQRVTVIGYSAAPIMRRPESLAVFGPGCSASTRISTVSRRW